MKNHTVFQGFHFVTFTKRKEDNLLIFTVFITIYLLCVSANLIIIAVVSLHRHLHTPMYLFLCNLSFVDIFYITVTVPKLLDMLVSGKNTMTFIQCFVQLYFYWTSGVIEDILLFTMAYDRYVAICSPLHYHSTFTKENLTKLIVVTWTTGFLNSIFVTALASFMSFCKSTNVNQFFCDIKALTKISCTITEVFYVAICLEVLFFAVCPFLCSLMSYVKIIGVIFKINSKEGRKKAFSTCSSHLSVLLIYMGSGLPVYLKPTSDNADVFDEIFGVFYSTVTPLLNPLIYSLRNDEVKMALLSSVKRLKVMMPKL